MIEKKKNTVGKDKCQFCNAITCSHLTCWKVNNWLSILELVTQQHLEQKDKVQKMDAKWRRN